MPPTETLARTIRRDGPVPFDWFVECALYDPDGGFFAGGRGAGRPGGDFITSPEVGSLFGALVARVLDRCWRSLERPDPFMVVEAGAGSGRLARDVLRAAPECLPALRYVLVERSAALRAAQRELLTIEPPDEALGPFTESDDAPPVPVEGAGPVLTALDDLPALAFDGVIIANELLDNLAFGIAEWSGDEWREIRVGLADESPGSRFVEVLVPAPPADVTALEALTDGRALAAGSRLPIPRGIDAWLSRCGAAMNRGFVVLIDYFDTVDGVLARGSRGWLRTYRGHDRGGSPFDDPGGQDITADVVIEALRRGARAAGFRVDDECSQAEWLRALGVDELVEEGRRAWEERAHLGDLAAIAGRSRVSEAAALTDPVGLGGHQVVTLRKA